MNLQEFQQLSAGHALHALSPDEELAFAQALAAHPEWQAIVDEDLETASEIGDAAHDVTPDASVRASLLSLIDGMPQAVASTPAAAPHVPATQEQHPGARTAAAAPGESQVAPSTARAGRRRALWAGAFVLAASVAVLTAVVLGPQFFGPAQDPAELALIEVSQARDAQAQTVQVAGGGNATLHWSDELDRAVLVTDQMPSPAPGHDVEVWLVRGDTPISAGVLSPEQDPAVLDDFRPGDVIALTVEDAGGSPTGAPTTEPIVAITTA